MPLSARPLVLGCAWIGGLASAWLGCFDTFHSTDWATACDLGDPACVSSGGGSAAGTAAAGGSGGGGHGGMGGASPASSSSAAGGGAAVCGNGEIEPGEQCDDANDDATDGCDACAIVCEAAREHLHPTTGHCYLHDPAIAADWATARKECALWHGDLVSIADATEQTFVVSFLGASSWTGGTDAVVEGTFVWADGEPFVFVNWNPGEPNDSGGNEDCLEIYGPRTMLFGLWNDMPCDALMSFVCERPPAGM